MTQLQRDMQSLLNTQKAINQKIKKIATAINKLEKAQASNKTKAKAGRKAGPAKSATASKPSVKKGKKVSASETVFDIIKRAKNGIDTATLKSKTGFKDDNIRMIVYRLKKQGKITSGGRGIYIIAE